MVMDRSPGYASAAKFIATTTYQTWLDSTVYTRPDVFILETMGRDELILKCLCNGVLMYYYHGTI